MQRWLIIGLFSLSLVFLGVGMRRQFRHRWPQWLFWLLSLACIIAASLLR